MAVSVASIIWLIGTAFELAFVICSLARRSFSKYLFLNLYLLLTLVSSFSRYTVLQRYGQASPEYGYCYYYTDTLLTIALYVALISLYTLVLGELRARQYVYFAAGILLVGTALVSYVVVDKTQSQLSTSFAFQLSQNLYFVGLILTYLLWGAVLKLRETRTRLIQFVLSLGLYFSAYAASYALVNLASKTGVVAYVGPALGCLLPLSWTITILRHSEESRLETAQLVAVPR